VQIEGGTLQPVRIGAAVPSLDAILITELGNIFVCLMLGDVE
jgi:hypothetical protein